MPGFGHCKAVPLQTWLWKTRDAPFDPPDVVALAAALLNMRESRAGQYISLRV